MSNELNELREQYATVTTVLSKGEISDFAINSLALIPIRDAVLRFAYDNPELRQVLVNALNSVDTSGLEPELSATIHTITAGTIWFDGDKEATRASLDKALEADSTYSLARLLDVALTHGVPSEVWSASIEAVSTDECLIGAE